MRQRTKKEEVPSCKKKRRHLKTLIKKRIIELKQIRIDELQQINILEANKGKINEP